MTDCPVLKVRADTIPPTLNICLLIHLLSRMIVWLKNCLADVGQKSIDRIHTFPFIWVYFRSLYVITGINQRGNKWDMVYWLDLLICSLDIVAGIVPEPYIHATINDRIQTCMFAYGFLIYCQIWYFKGSPDSAVQKSAGSRLLKKKLLLFLIVALPVIEYAVIAFRFIST